MLTIYYILSLHFFGYPPPVYFFITIVVTDLSNVFSLPPHLTLLPPPPLCRRPPPHLSLLPPPPPYLSLSCCNGLESLSVSLSNPSSVCLPVVRFLSSTTQRCVNLIIFLQDCFCL